MVKGVNNVGYRSFLLIQVFLNKSTNPLCDVVKYVADFSEQDSVNVMATN